MSRSSALAGVFAPICTPFSANEDLDPGALAENVRRYAESGIHGYLALGSNGENRSLTEEERLAALDVVVRQRDPGQVVMAGAAYDAQRQTERFVRAAADVGADYALVLSPGYFRKQMTTAILERYFSTLADTAPIPIVLYNAPGFNGVTLEAELVARLAMHPNIVGMKDSARSGIEAFLALQRPDFEVLAGSANFLFRAMLAGSPGGTVSLANSFPAVALLAAAGGARDAANAHIGKKYRKNIVLMNSRRPRPRSALGEADKGPRE